MQSQKFPFQLIPLLEFIKNVDVKLCCEVCGSILLEFQKQKPKKKPFECKIMLCSAIEYISCNFYIRAIISLNAIITDDFL